MTKCTEAQNTYGARAEATLQAEGTIEWHKPRQERAKRLMTNQQTKAQRANRRDNT